MQIQLANNKKKVDVSETVFGVPYNGPLIHQVVTAYMAAGRAGTKAQKTRSQVSGGGIKPWRQKGTGRARAGTTRSPIWRKGGVTFAAVPRNFEQKVNKKMYRGAIRSILSELLRLERLIVLDAFEMEGHKTKSLLAKLNELNAGNDALIILEAVNENIYLAARNVPNVDVCDVAATSPVSLINAEKVVISAAALKQFEELLK